MKEKVEQVLNKVRPAPQADGGDVEPALRASFAPRPGTSSTQCTRVAGGMIDSGKLLPTLKSFVVALSEVKIVSPGLSAMFWLRFFRCMTSLKIVVVMLEMPAPAIFFSRVLASDSRARSACSRPRGGCSRRVRMPRR